VHHPGCRRLDEERGDIGSKAGSNGQRGERRDKHCRCRSQRAAPEVIGELRFLFRLHGEVDGRKERDE
jgi:hypothetical protein